MWNREARYVACAASIDPDQCLKLLQAAEKYKGDLLQMPKNVPFGTLLMKLGKAYEYWQEMMISWGTC